MNKVIITACWSASVVIAYWFGLSNERGNGTITPETDSASGSSKEVISFPEKESDDREIDLREISENELSPARPSIGIEEFNNDPKENENVSELVASHPIKRLKAFAELLENPNAQTIEYAAKAYESLPGGPGRFSELQMLSFAWGQVDPEGALKWAKNQQHWGEHVASSSIMDSWARYDANAAIAWAKENFEGEENPFFVGIINGLSETSLPQATDLMTDLPYGRVRGRAARILFEKVWSKGEDLAIHWAEHLPQGSLQNFAFGELGEKVAQSDMPRAIEWIESMEESSLKLALTEKIAKEMARGNPYETARWANTLPEGKSKTAAMYQLAEMWARKDPVATAEWINLLPADENKDPLIETLVNKIHKSDPQSALVWAETISNSERRIFLTEKVLNVIKTEKFHSDQSK